MAHPTGLLSPIDHHHSGRMSNLGGTHSVKVWSPGDRVVFYRSWDVMVLFTLFLLVLGIGCGDFAFWVTEDEKAAPSAFFVMWGLCLLLVWMGIQGTRYYLPHTVTFNWKDQTVKVATPFTRWILPFAQIEALILQTKLQGKGGAFVIPIPYPNRANVCVRLIVAKKSGGPESPTFELVQSDYEEELDLVMKTWAPVLTELSFALQVPGKVVDMDGRLLDKVEQPLL